MLTPTNTALPQNTFLTRDPELWRVAQSLEASFLSEMLKSAGVGEAPSAFGGGEGEEQFSSFMVQAQADAIVEAGGVGLAEAIYTSLSKSSGET